MLQVQKFTFNPFQENTYVIFDDESKEAFIIDPGCYHSHEEMILSDFISKKELKVTKMLNTHCHIDHVLGNLYVSEKYGVDLYIHLADLPTLQAIDSYAHIYGMGGYKTSPLPSHHLSEGDLLKLGDYGLDILFVPGHAPGHVAFVSKEQKWVINGDCLFQGSIGRTDLPGGDFETLTNSIKVKLYSLPDEYTVYCGHGSETTIGFEKRNNPFVKG